MYAGMDRTIMSVAMIPVIFQFRMYFLPEDRLFEVGMRKSEKELYQTESPE